MAVTKPSYIVLSYVSRGDPEIQLKKRDVPTEFLFNLDSQILIDFGCFKPYFMLPVAVCYCFMLIKC